MQQSVRILQIKTAHLLARWEQVQAKASVHRGGINWTPLEPADQKNNWAKAHLILISCMSEDHSRGASQPRKSRSRDTGFWRIHRNALFDPSLSILSRTVLVDKLFLVARDENQLQLA